MFKKFIFVALFGILLAMPQVVQAQEFSLVAGMSDNCRDNGICTVCDVASVFKQIITIGVAFSGPILLFVVVWGGTVWLTSGGNPERIQKGRQVLVGGVVGILFVLLAWQIVHLVILTLIPGQQGGFQRLNAQPSILSQPWSSITCTEEKSSNKDN